MVGRPKATRAFKEIMDAVLFDDSAKTIEKLEELRDSDDAQDRATFWRLAAKLMPQAVQVEAVDDVTVTLNFAGGRDGTKEGFRSIGNGGELHSIDGGRAGDDRPDQ